MDEIRCGTPECRVDVGVSVTERRRLRVSRLILSSALVVGMVFVGEPSVGAAGIVSVDRIEGDDRFSTSVSIAARYDATDLVLASGERPADALAAAALARQEDADIMLLPASGDLPWSTLAAMRSENYSRVWIVGGTSALPSSIEEVLAKPVWEGGVGIAPTSIERVSGANRYETAAQVAGRITLVATVKGKNTAFVVSGENFADAVLAAPAVAGPVGSVGVVPILLVGRDSLPAATSAAIGSLGITQVFTLGGSAVISDRVIGALRDRGVEVFPIFGANRYETALHLGNVLTASVGAGGFGWSASNVGLANLSQARGGADALAASQLLARTRSVLLGTDLTLPAETSAWLAGKPGQVQALTVLGGTASVPDTAVGAAVIAAGG